MDYLLSPKHSLIIDPSVDFDYHKTFELIINNLYAYRIHWANSSLQRKMKYLKEKEMKSFMFKD